MDKNYENNYFDNGNVGGNQNEYSQDSRTIACSSKVKTY